MSKLKLVFGIAFLLFISTAYSQNINTARLKPTKTNALNEFAPDSVQSFLYNYVGTFYSKENNKENSVRSLIYFSNENIVNGIRDNRVLTACLNFNFEKVNLEISVGGNFGIEIQNPNQRWHQEGDAPTWDKWDLYSGEILKTVNIVQDGEYTVCGFTDLVNGWLSNFNNNKGLLIKAVNEDELKYYKFDVSLVMETIERNECVDNGGMCRKECGSGEIKVDYDCGILSRNKCCVREEVQTAATKTTTLPGTASSGEEVAGETPTELQCTKCPDVNGDGVVNTVDLSLVSRDISQDLDYQEDYDINEDGVVDRSDVECVSEGFGKSVEDICNIQVHRSFARSIGETSGADDTFTTTTISPATTLPLPPTGMNLKNKDMYTDKQVFLVSDKDWKKVLPWVSAAIWEPQKTKAEKKGWYLIPNKPLYLDSYFKIDKNIDLDSLVFTYKLSRQFTYKVHLSIHSVDNQGIVNPNPVAQLTINGVDRALPEGSLIWKLPEGVKKKLTPGTYQIRIFSEGVSGGAVPPELAFSFQGVPENFANDAFGIPGLGSAISSATLISKSIESAFVAAGITPGNNRDWKDFVKDMIKNAGAKIGQPQWTNVVVSAMEAAKILPGSGNWGTVLASSLDAAGLKPKQKEWVDAVVDVMEAENILPGTGTWDNALTNTLSAAGVRRNTPEWTNLIISSLEATGIKKGDEGWLDAVKHTIAATGYTSGDSGFTNVVRQSLLAVGVSNDDLDAVFQQLMEEPTPALETGQQTTQQTGNAQQNTKKEDDAFVFNSFIFRVYERLDDEGFNTELVYEYKLQEEDESPDKEWCNTLRFDDEQVYPRPVETCAYPFLIYHEEDFEYTKHLVREFSLPFGFRSKPIISGNKVAWDGKDNNFYIWDMATDELKTIPQEEGRIAEYYDFNNGKLVWLSEKSTEDNTEDDKIGIGIRIVIGKTDSTLYIYDSNTDVTEKIKENIQGTDLTVSISDNRFVWAEKNEDYNIYMCDISGATQDIVTWCNTDGEKGGGLYKITTRDGDQKSPIIQGTKIVWLDNVINNIDIYPDFYLCDIEHANNYYSEWCNTPKSEGGGLQKISQNKKPTNDFDIDGSSIVYSVLNDHYQIIMYNLESNQISQISETLGTRPSIQGNRIVWEGHDNVIYIYNILTHETEKLSSRNLISEHPDIQDDIVVWTQSGKVIVYSLAGSPQKNRAVDADSVIDFFENYGVKSVSHIIDLSTPLSKEGENAPDNNEKIRQAVITSIGTEFGGNFNKDNYITKLLRFHLKAIL